MGNAGSGALTTRSGQGHGDQSSRGEGGMRAEGSKTGMRLRIQQSQTSASRNLHARGGCTEIVEPSAGGRSGANPAVGKLTASASLRNLVDAGLRHLGREDSAPGASTSRRPPQEVPMCMPKPSKSGLAKPYVTQIHTSLQKRPLSRNHHVNSSQGFHQAGSRINGPIAAAKTQFRITSHKLDMLIQHPDQSGAIPPLPASHFNKTQAGRPPTTKSNKNIALQIMKNKSAAVTQKAQKPRPPSQLRVTPRDLLSQI